MHHSSDDLKKLLYLLADYFFKDNPLKKFLGYSNVRLNFAGGEPVVLGSRFVTTLLHARQLGFKTSITTNGHLLSDHMLKRIGVHLDMLGISFDTADHFLAESIGRVDRKNDWLSPKRLKEITILYRTLNPSGKLKINTVVNAYNWRENLSNLITDINPNKWKLLRVLPVYSSRQEITTKEFEFYIKNHIELKNIITIEDNDDMWQSYLMINPKGKFYQNSGACEGFIHSKSILDIGVKQALSFIKFDTKAFSKRYK